MSELTITDQRLKPVAEKVLAGERLTLDDGIALYRSPDVLAVGWLANSIREKRYGNTCFFSSSEPRRIRPMVPSLLTAGINDADASTRATSSITMQAATESAP